MNLPENDFFDPSMLNLSGEGPLLPETDCASLSAVLSLVEPQISPALLDAAGLTALHHIGKHISAHLSVFWGIELRLGDADPRVDLLWKVSQGNGGVAVLAGRDPIDPAAEATSALRARSPFWRELGSFAEQWLDSPGWLQRMDNIWLEVDTTSVTEPSVAQLDALLNRPSLFCGSNNRVAGSDRELLKQLPALARRFYGLDLDQPWLEAVATALPPEAEVFQMGVMGARAPQPVTRLCLRCLDAASLVHWLAVLGWSGNGGQLRQTLTRLLPLCGSIALNVDILPDRVGPRLGVECYPALRSFSMDTWEPLFKELAARGLVRADKLAALGDFPCYQRFQQVLAWRRSPPISSPVLATNLHHLKLVFVEDEVVEAKAYLAIFRPIMYYASPSAGGSVNASETPPPFRY